jgi:hypothetical protein
MKKVLMVAALFLASMQAYGQEPTQMQQKQNPPQASCLDCGLLDYQSSNATTSQQIFTSIQPTYDAGMEKYRCIGFKHLADGSVVAEHCGPSGIGAYSRFPFISERSAGAELHTHSAKLHASEEAEFIKREEQRLMAGDANNR